MHSPKNCFYFFLCPIVLFMTSCEPDRPVYNSLDEYPIYAFADLGVTYSPSATTFKFWSPAAQRARVKLYVTDQLEEEPDQTIDMKEVDGAWTATVDRNLDGVYYTYQIRVNGNWKAEATDPYARAVGTNGLRGQVVNLRDTDPDGWATDSKPIFGAKQNAILYELHVRDLSIDPNSGIEHKGKFLGLTERGTTTPSGLATGLDHLVEMGITHVHLLPSYDFFTVDESRPDDAQYNWGYDPQNYNVPEGSYSTDPADGKVRIREFKQMVMALHEAGIRVIMDVVYNHTGRSEDSHFQELIPDYFYRFRKDGTMSDASGCGNEIASERPMVRKYIRESVAYWMREYHVDGFRFDLMGIHDIATMNEISKQLHEIEPTVLLYGEGWMAAKSPLPDSLLALKANTARLDRIAAFSDDYRDGIKGSVFEHEEKGFVSGARNLEQTIRFGVVGATRHDQIAYDSVNYSSAPWAPEPTQAISYASCHDNHTLWDRLAISNPQDGSARREKMQRLALAMVLTSQGIPFLHAGSEMCRTKGGEENSYKSGDDVNAIKWKDKARHEKTLTYVKDLIALRKTHPAFRLGTTAAIQQHLNFIETEDDQLVAYRIAGVPEDSWNDIIVLYNGAGNSKRLDLPEGKWAVMSQDGLVDTEGIGRPVMRRVTVAGASMTVLVQ
ncbi:type I pullulanase [Neolewinella antarctica]|uniref:Pullulanase n=1 Tax=Neolewinella antarctica TaxID=442734 RepID=A0ABX0X799_9BACT|nr:type I pullulanase [Neolewinella antarctica]NJC25090.1 pullulanase [Neolewinella antarctica]